MPWYVKSNIPTLCGQKMTQTPGNIRDALGTRPRAIHAFCQAMAHILTATASSAAQKKHVWRIWSKPLRK